MIGDQMANKELVSDWRNSGIEPGDTILIHSSLKRTFLTYAKKGTKLTPADILNSFIEAVGPQGTLLFPLFNFSFTRGETFYLNHTPSHMGALTESARVLPGSIRTAHPIYSFAVIGCHAPEFEYINNKSGYGRDSAFAKLRDLDGKIGILNLSDQDSMTFYHHIEEMHDVPYRYHKEFSGLHADATGKATSKTYSIFVRNLDDGIVTHVNPMGELLWQNNIYSGFRPNEGSGLRVCKANKVFSYVSNVIKAGNALGNLYKIEK